MPSISREQHPKSHIISTSSSHSDLKSFPLDNDLQYYHFSTSYVDKEFKNVIEAILRNNPEVNQDLTFIILFKEVTSENGIDKLVLLCEDDIRLLHCQSRKKLPALSNLEIADIHYLQFFLEKLQENEIYSVNSNFVYYSIERKSFRDFWSSNERVLDDGIKIIPVGECTLHNRFHYLVYLSFSLS